MYASPGCSSVRRNFFLAIARFEVVNGFHGLEGHADGVAGHADSVPYLRPHVVPLGVQGLQLVGDGLEDAVALDMSAAHRADLAAM